MKNKHAFLIRRHSNSIKKIQMMSISDSNSKMKRDSEILRSSELILLHKRDQKLDQNLEILLINIQKKLIKMEIQLLVLMLNPKMTLKNKENSINLKKNHNKLKNPNQKHQKKQIKVMIKIALMLMTSLVRMSLIPWTTARH